MLRSVALVRTDVSEERSFSIIKVTRIDELETTFAITSNRRTVRWRRSVPPKRRLLQEPHGVNIPEDVILHSYHRENHNLTLH
jgi:hypothetical protein